ncbi:MAG: DUF3536 domain-containing protein [SAR202 cluster bacterium]|nr:DUF3536 domain-containing protein [SAR202 cluster bacterium]
MPERYVCIHGHFYQPPRENPWLETIELQDSAYPYHDWNERVNAECYAPNGASRLLDERERVANIINNYARISFNFGPTLLSWMEKNASETYDVILQADEESQRQFSGHGSAIAQAYNHMILPLANERDKYTQVLWGIRDFEHRFHRFPEGMWLPETAVDTETLETLAELGIRFTVLSPFQAQRVRAKESENWQDVTGGRIDPTSAYTLNLPSGRTIDLFFYDDSIHQAVTSEFLLSRGGHEFSRRLVEKFSGEKQSGQLVHMAADGESYGHHHGNGDMALAFALHHIESNNLARITNYGEYLSINPPTREVEIREGSSWTCVHGIERWRSDCGCNSGEHQFWNQAWRAPLRAALDWLRDDAAASFEESAGELLADPWGARNEYIQVVLDRSEPVVSRFFEAHNAKALSQDETARALKLLEMQRNSMLMYTSCGWFFEELSGLETVQVIQYAGRVVQLGRELFGEHWGAKFRDLLAEAKSNIPSNEDGLWIYDNLVLPGMVDLVKVAAHYAVSSLFEEYPERSEIFGYAVDLEDRQLVEAGRARLSLGRSKVTNSITTESAVVSFGVLHLGDHNVNAGVREYQGDAAYQAMVTELTETFNAAEFPEVIRAMDRHFGEPNYSLRSLFKDEQRKILNQVLESTMTGVEAVQRQQYEANYPLMRFLVDSGNPVPPALHSAAELIIGADLMMCLDQDSLDIERIQGLLEDARLFSVTLDTEGLAVRIERNLSRVLKQVTDKPQELPNLEAAIAVAKLARSMPFAVDLWRVQNLFHSLTHNSYPQFRKKADRGDSHSLSWLRQFTALGNHLSVNIE